MVGNVYFILVLRSEILETVGIVEALQGIVDLFYFIFEIFQKYSIIFYFYSVFS